MVRFRNPHRFATSVLPARVHATVAAWHQSLSFSSQRRTAPLPGSAHCLSRRRSNSTGASLQTRPTHAVPGASAGGVTCPALAHLLRLGLVHLHSACCLLRGLARPSGRDGSACALRQPPPSPGSSLPVTAVQRRRVRGLLHRLRWRWRQRRRRWRRRPWGQRWLSLFLVEGFDHPDQLGAALECIGLLGRASLGDLDRRLAVLVLHGERLTHRGCCGRVRATPDSQDSVGWLHASGASTGWARTQARAPMRPRDAKTRVVGRAVATPARDESRSDEQPQHARV